MSGHLDWVFLDIGGPIYSDEPYRLAIRDALRELGASFTDAESEEKYASCRGAQRGSFKRRLARRFLRGGADVRELTRLASRRWQYGPEALCPDVLPVLEELRALGYRLDYDVSPARAVGMRTVWVLGGEAPASPTPEQFAVPDASVWSLAELPDALERLR